MSLVLWLPLNGDLRNQGTSDCTFSILNDNNKIISNNSGKIGKCYERTAANTDTLRSSINFNLSGDISMACWAYVTSANEAANGLITNHNHNNNSGVGITVKNVSSIDYRICCNTGDGSTRTYATYYGTTNIKDAWHHLALTYSKNTKILQLWVDGIVEYTLNNYDNKSTNEPFDLFNWSIGNYTSSSYKTICKLNDVRLYDHCLSDLEAKQLAQGLIAHYKLDDRFIAKTMFVNGFGELGTENWNPSYVSSTEIPSADTSIKGSTYNGNNTSELLPINNNTVYELSAYIKSMGATSGTTHPSIFPYDADGKMIMVYNCAAGCASSYITTLAQPLKKGDTVIYATDLSAWTTANNNYYYHVTIFGYRDSYGRLYPDMGYSADSPKFGSYSDKSNINKTNNTITLLSAYTGENRPAGTVICQATEGSTYVYPFGGIALSTLSDWVLKSTTFSPLSLDHRLRYAKYIRFSDYNNTYVAGLKLVDTKWATDIVHDSSGFNNNGVTWAYDEKGAIEVSRSTPRNSLSTLIYSEDAATNVASGTRYIYGYCPLTTPECLTVAFWCKPNGGRSNATTDGQFSLTNNDIGNTAAADYNTAPMNHRDGTIDINSVATVKTIRPSITFTKDEWHHYAITYDGRYGKVYKDGVLSDTKDMGSNKTLGDMKGIVMGFSKAGGVWRKNRSQYSDFRLYVTALSADDVKDLYQSAGHVDDQGQFHSYEFYETDSNVSLTNQGQFKLRTFSETLVCPYDTNFYEEPDGSVWIRVFHHGDPTNNGLFTSTDTFDSAVYKDVNRWMYMSILNKITNSTYELMVKQAPTYGSTEQKYRWIQTVNPYNAVFGDVDAADVTKITTEGYSTHTSYGGIYKHNSSSTYFCANNGNSANWFGAIGCLANYQGGIPAYAAVTVTTGYYDLYLRVDNQFTDRASIFNNSIVANSFKEK